MGNQESWFVEDVPLPAGHLASLTIVNEKEVMDVTAFLRRTKIANHPEYNQIKTDVAFQKDNKIFFDEQGYTNPSENDTGVSSLSAQGFSLSYGIDISPINENSFNRMILNRHTLEFDNLPTAYGTTGRLKITASYFNKDLSTTPASILMESDNRSSTPGSIHLVAKADPSITLKTADSSNKLAELQANSLLIKNNSDQATVHPTLINTYAEGSIAQISASAPFSDLTYKPLQYIKGWSQKSELTAHWLRLPVYHYKAGQFSSGTGVGHTVCGAFGPNSQEFNVPTGNGRLFMVTEESSQKFNLFICNGGTAHIISTRPIKPGE